MYPLQGLFAIVFLFAGGLDLLAQVPDAAPPPRPDFPARVLGPKSANQPQSNASQASNVAPPASYDSLPNALPARNSVVEGNGQPVQSQENAEPASPATDATGVPPGDATGQTFWTRPTFTGDWLGLRPRLQEQGIRFDGNVAQFGFGLGGGITRTLPLVPALGLGDTAAYTGRGDYGLTFDLDKFGGMPHGKLQIRAQHWWGQYGNVSLNTGSFPPAIFPASIPPVPNDAGVPYITDFVLTQPLSKNWVVFAGKKNVIGAADQDDFAGGNGTSQFMNQAFIANPAFLLALPYSSFTAGFVSPREWGSFGAFVYDPQDRTQNFFKLDDLFSQGVIVGGEVKVKSNFFGLPGEHHVGGLWKHLQMTDLRFNEPAPGQYPYQAVTGFATLWDAYTIYYGFDQYLQTYCDNPQRGWGLFGRASISDGNPTPVRYFLSLGIGGYSPIRQHRGDTFGAGFYYVGTSREFGPLPRALFGPREGWGMEVFYNFQINPWMNFTPDFQVIRPEAGAIAKTAYIGGVRLNLKF